MTEDRLEGECRETQAPRRGRLFRLLWPVTAYLVTNITVTCFGVLFFMLNRTTVLGRRNVGEHPNTLLLSNHQFRGGIDQDGPLGRGAFHLEVS